MQQHNRPTCRPRNPSPFGSRNAAYRHDQPCASEGNAQELRSDRSVGRFAGDVNGRHGS